MAQPDYVICLECETPVYAFEWADGHVVEVTCPICGNEDSASFATEDELDEMAASEAPEDEGFEE